MDRWSRGLVNQSISEAQRGHYELQVGLIVIPRMWLKGFDVITYITKVPPSF